MLAVGLMFAPDAVAALVETRSALWSMMDAKDKSAQDALNAKVQAASTKFDSILAGMTGGDAFFSATLGPVCGSNFEVPC